MPQSASSKGSQIASDSEPTCRVQDFLDYREFIKASFEIWKKRMSGFSLRYFAKKAQLGGHSYLTMVLNGERNISPATLTKLSKALGLSREDAVYFENLVFYNQVKNDEDKVRYFDRLLAMREKAGITKLSPDQLQYFANAHAVVIREMAALKEFRDDPEWIAEHLFRKIPAKEVETILGALTRLGLLVRDADGKLRHSGKSLQSPIDCDAYEIINYHRRVLADARYAMSLAPHGEWDVTSMVIPVPKEQISEVMNIMQKCREDIVHLINRGSKNFHEVYQLNMQLFPVTKTKRAKSQGQKK